MDAIIKTEVIENEPAFLNTMEQNEILNVDVNDEQTSSTNDNKDFEETTYKVEIEVQPIFDENNDCDSPEISNSDIKKDVPKKKRRSGRARKLGTNETNNVDPLSDAPDGHSRRSRNKSTDKKDDIPIDLFLKRVKENPVLYDLTHPDNDNNRLRDKVWDTLAEEFNSSGGHLKSKLRSLRDTYKKYLKVNSIANEQQQNKWQWASHMEFMRPHIDLARLSNADNNRREENKYSGSYKNSNEDLTRKSNGSSARNRRSHGNLAIIDKVVDYLNEKSMREYDKLDATDHFFLSMAKTVKTFSAERQAYVKNKIFQLVQEYELMHLTENKV